MTTGDGARLLIGDLAERVEVNAKTIRYYEEIGLLPRPARSPAGYRLYRAADAERLRFIKGVRRLGFSLGEIGEVLALRDRGEQPCNYVTGLLERRAHAVDRQVAELKQLKRELAELRRRASSRPAHDPGTGGYCHILEGGAADGRTPGRA